VHDKVSSRSSPDQESRSFFHESPKSTIFQEFGVLFCYLYMSRVLYQSGMRVVQGMKEQASMCDSWTIKSLRDSACSSSSSSKQARRFSGSVDSSGYKIAKSDKYKQAEENLRTVMFLSFWGPN